MANKIKVKLILELRANHMSRNTIAKTRHISKNSVSEVFHIADSLGISFQDIKEKDEQDVYRMFFPDKHAGEDMYTPPDYEYVHNELRRVGVTLKLLWEEYRGKCALDSGISMGYTKFCDGYGKHITANSITNHLTHKPGIVTEVDWSGPTMSYVNGVGGEIITVYLFVGTLPYSQYSYVEPCLDMKQDTWLRCHVNMYEFWGGTTVRTVCDNLKTGVISHPKEGDIVLNANYEALGSHYMTAIMPTGVKKPKQKASVEGNVGKIATAIIAKLRDQTFFSFADLLSAVKEKLTAFNDEEFQKREGSRSLAFEEERTYLNPLPTIPYEIAEWVYGRSVNFDCHVVYAKNRYSCPYQYVGQKADLKITDSTVEIYVNGERAATHIKFPNYVNNKYSTRPEDMPDRFQRPEWDDERIKRWAYSIGTHVGDVIDRIFCSVKIKEQGYNPSLSVLRLGKSYSDARLEIACELALTRVRTPRYNHIKAILASNQDRIYLEQKNASQKSGVRHTGGYVRGPEYYGGHDDD